MIMLMVIRVGSTHLVIWGVFKNDFLKNLSCVCVCVCEKISPLLQYNRVWVPDAEQVWKSAELLRDYTPGDPALHLQLEDGAVSIRNIRIHTMKGQKFLDT